MTELARLDLRTKTAEAGAEHAEGEASRAARALGGSFGIFPVDWNGGWVLKEIGQLPVVAKTRLLVREERL